MNATSRYTFAPGTPAVRYESWVRQRRLLMLARHVGRCANYTLIFCIALMLLWVAATVFVAFHSGRVRQILSQPQPQMRVASTEGGK